MNTDIEKLIKDNCDKTVDKITFIPNGRFFISFTDKSQTTLLDQLDVQGITAQEPAIRFATYFKLRLENELLKSNANVDIDKYKKMMTLISDHACGLLANNLEEIGESNRQILKFYYDNK